MVLENLINFLDNNFHHKRIIKYLKNHKIDLVIDVGAHKGEFLINIIPHVPFKKAYTFEPQLDVFSILKKKLNNDERIKHNNLALSEIIEKKKITINKLTSTSSLSEFDNSSIFLKIKNFLLRQKNEELNSYEVTTTTIDNYFEELDLSNSLLKIDVEGYELNVLKGSKNTIKKIKFVLIENQLFNIYKNNNEKDWHDYLMKNKFTLIKKFRFPLLHFEDRLYKNSLI
jgi:FkbM family methyltransferase